MHDIKLIRKYPDKFDEGLVRRGLEPMSIKILEVDERRRNATTELQKLQARRKELSKSIGRLKKLEADI